MSLDVGDIFADYTIVKKLGSGGMGEVYLARHPRLPRNDALKLLPTEWTGNAEYRARFEREADLAADLWHPHIVGVHDRGEYHGQLWISMNYVEGTDAAKLLDDRFPAGMPDSEVAEIVTAVADALDYAHDRGLLHRDVKPANILLTTPSNGRSRRVLLADFGIARQRDEVSGLTATGMTVGSVLYAAPEQLMGEDIDGRADQYALAATAYHLLTGVPVFPHTTPARVISHHLNTPPPALATHRAALMHLDPVISAAMAKEPTERFNSCQAFALALTQRISTSAGQHNATELAVPLPAPKAKGAPQGGTEKKADRTSQLAPGWYPDPKDRSRNLYWSGHGWHTAPTPNTRAAKADERTHERGSRRPKVVLWGIGAIAAFAAAAVAYTLLSAEPTTRPTDSAASTSPLPTASRPSLTRVDLPPRTVTRPPSTVTLPPSTVVAPMPTPPPRPQASNAMIIGTCDEGGSCGLKQRNAPYSEAPRLFPNDLQDGNAISVRCGVIGDLRASSGRSSRAWYRLTNGAYIAAVYTTLDPSLVPAC